jgi:hypothetical protein
MDFGQQRLQQQDAAKMMMYQNPGYQFERRTNKSLIVEVTMGTSPNTFDVDLFEPLLIDKLSDIYLDSFTTFNAIDNNAIENSFIVLHINEFNVQSNIATNLHTGATSFDSTKYQSILIPNEATDETNTHVHKGKKMNYVCSSNPTKLTKLSGKITNAGTSANPPVYGTAFAGTGRFVAEFVIVARE